MKEDVYIFVGQSGSGKGTQAKLLIDRLRQIAPTRGILYLETGNKFREIIATETTTARRTRALMDAGKLPPPFLGIHAWSHYFIFDYEEAKAVIMDGTPRVPDEVPILLTAFRFYEMCPHIINLSVSDEWSYDRLKARGRADDKSEIDLWGRIQWYHESAAFAIQSLRAADCVTFHDIHGEQSVEAVHADICQALGLM